MAQAWLYTFVSVTIVSLLSLVGIIAVGIKRSILDKLLLILVSFSAGALLGGAFFHLLPEAVHEVGYGLRIAAYLLSGIITFFVLEKFICWRHCHIPTSANHPHPVAFMNLVGDAFHNFIDGMIIAGSFIVSIPLGITTTLAVILHEVPQEIGDFGVLVYGGFSRLKALGMNLLVALTAFLGALVVLVLNYRIEHVGNFLLPFAAGGFIYIAGSDLIPELKKDIKLSNSIFQLISLLLGVGLMLLLVLWE
ncbi:MAG: ZIP family metal transporter [Candidatus Margulisbacteria bacterium]|nr:ZIP family metal transporter [Candidatus Margulisiibacteriota bacterium]MBU1021061.1 ZIP family metal transporter [Candidatus Margulisiibacteriota bacterium]MBU1729736.1 ZIP family metal transporter [Candidatus Margulisiibacteriota bacterium]MBU1956001.1 ZIP family metal transporter [Candidatus Margulisiibacteriota bacterium]